MSPLWQRWCTAPPPVRTAHWHTFTAPSWIVHGVVVAPGIPPNSRHQLGLPLPPNPTAPKSRARLIRCVARM
eukprot:scaffold4797_cov164-Isochrysis_galbana.AAC.1